MLKMILTTFACLTSSALACNQATLEKNWGTPTLGKSTSFLCLDAIQTTMVVREQGYPAIGIAHNNFTSGRLTYRGTLQDVFKKVIAKYTKTPEFNDAKLANEVSAGLLGIDMRLTKEMLSNFRGYSDPVYLKNARIRIMAVEPDGNPGIVHVSYLLYTMPPN